MSSSQEDLSKMSVKVFYLLQVFTINQQNHEPLLWLLTKLVINRNIWRLNCYLRHSCSFLQALVFLFYVSFPSSATCELFLIKTIEMFSRS